MAFEEIAVKTRAAKGEGSANRKAPWVRMTDGKKFVFNLHAATLIGDVEGMGATVLRDAESGNIGFRFSKGSVAKVVIGAKTITVKANIVDALPEELKTGKFEASVAWNKDAQVWEAGFGEAKRVAKRGETLTEAD